VNLSRKESRLLSFDPGSLVQKKKKKKKNKKKKKDEKKKNLLAVFV